MDNMHTSYEKSASDFLDVNGVRITPSRLELLEIPDKKEYKSKITLQNIGKSTAFIRITPPASKYYKVECIPRGQYLSPGLRIVKHVEVFHDNSGVPDETLLPIFINDKRHDYLIVLKPMLSSILVTPQSIDFGMLNTAATHVTKTILIENKAIKDISFQIDTTQCHPAVVLEPIRGKIRVGGIFEVCIRVISFGELALNTSFDIRCDYTITKILVKAKIINSKLEVLHPHTTQHFTLLEFPPTYFGLSSTVNVFIRNYSGIPVMFSTTGEIHHRKVNLDTIKKKSMNFKFFDLYPTNGNFHENETKLFAFQLRRMTFENDISALMSGAASSRTHTSFDPSLLQFNGRDLLEDSIYKLTYEKNILRSLTSKSSNDFTRVHLYATAEIADVEIIPDEIYIKDMPIQKSAKRVLSLTNKSKNLPIILQYRKIPCVYLERENLYLEPLQKLEVAMSVIPTSYGYVETEIAFNLMYYDIPKTKANCKIIGESKMTLKFNIVVATKYPKPSLNYGLKPSYIKEVGKSNNIKFNTNVEQCKAITVDDKSVIDDNCCDIVAFPDDAQYSTKPCRSTETYRTIFSKQGRYKASLNNDYELSITEFSLKHAIREYYMNFIRSEFKKIMLTLDNSQDRKSEYQLTMMYKVLCENLKISRSLSLNYKRAKKGKYYLPLIPQEMNNIIITPPIIHSGQIANQNFYTFTIRIENKNNIPIRVWLKSDKLNIMYTKGPRYTINPHTCTAITMSYKTTYVGYYSTNLYVIINESAAHSVPILAEVVPNTLQINNHVIKFDNKRTYQYIELTNRLNIAIPFSWVVINDNFSIEPRSGMIRAGGKITCASRFLNNLHGPNDTVAHMYCGESTHQKVKLLTKISFKKLTLVEKELNFGEITLNEPVMLPFMLKNCEAVPLHFSIEEYEILQGLMVLPLEGVLQPSCFMNIYVTANFPTCVKFNYSLKINTLMVGSSEISIKGIVVYPDIVITPTVFNFAKIPASTTTNLQFKIKNNSVVLARIKFDLSEYEEFSIFESEHHYNQTPIKEITLAAKEVQTLFMHFNPVDTQSCFFYLPIIINNMIGPPLYSDTISTKTQYYLTNFLDNCEYITVPEYLPVVKVKTLVMPPKIYFSKTTVELSVTPIKRHTNYMLHVKNTQSHRDDVCIRTDNLKHPVYMAYMNGAEVIIKEFAYIISLGPDEDTCFDISFKPTEYEFGDYRVLLPVYIRSDNSLIQHCIINIHAKYKRPGIYAKTDGYVESAESYRFDNRFMYYIEPTPPVNQPLTILKRLTFSNHLPNCNIATYTKNMLNKSIIQILGSTKIQENEDCYSVDVAFTIIPMHNSICCLTWVIKCSCGGRWEQHANGIVENSLFTTYCMDYYIFSKYAEDKEIKLEYLSYPFYPTKTYINYTYMENCIASIESWLYTQVTYGQWNYGIPSSICFAIFEPPTADVLRKQTQLSRIPIIHLLGNLVGPEIVSHLQPSQAPTDKLDEMRCMYQINCKVLEFIRNQGGYLGYIRPEYLLMYCHFKAYKCELFVDEDIPLPLSAFVDDYVSFVRISKQSWLDFLLQIYKTLYLNKLVTKQEKLGTIGKLQNTPLGKFYAFRDHTPFSPHIYDINEGIILRWLEYNYKENKDKIWPNGNSLKDCDVDLFNGNLQDGIIFAVAIATYCPYLISSMENIYLEPLCQEEMYHNVTKVIQCMEMLNYSFKITAEQIVCGNFMKAFMFSVYLFEVLPYMYPTDVITMKTGLSTTTTVKIEIYNENNFPIAYQPIFIGNEHNCFSTDRNIYEVMPKKKISICISYFARFAKQFESTLLLSGECIGYRYATNKCISLQGIPDLNFASSVITYKQELFKCVYFDFTIQSPYKSTAKYNMQQTYDTLHEPLELSSIIYHLDRDRISCARLITLNETFVFDENGRCTIHSVIGTLTNATISTWLYFTNETVGDFAVKFVSIVMDTKEREVLNVIVPKHLQLIKEWPNNLTVEIPNRNTLFFNAMQSLLVKITEGDETEFWNKISGTPMGINILENLLSTKSVENKLGTTVRCKSVTYTVSVAKDIKVTLPKTIVFDDEYSAGFCKVPLLLQNIEYGPQDFDFTLESTEAPRKRFYTVHFIQK